MYFQLTRMNIRLLGTLHRLPPDNAGLPAWVGQSYNWCGTLVLESDVPTLVPFSKRPTRSGCKPSCLATSGLGWAGNFLAADGPIVSVIRTEPLGRCVIGVAQKRSLGPLVCISDSLSLVIADGYCCRHGGAVGPPNAACLPSDPEATSRPRHCTIPVSEGAFRP